MNEIDEDSFAAVFRAHYESLVRAAQRLLHERAAAEDVAQEVMLELWRRRDALEPDISLKAYLHRATRNRALNQIRHARTVESAVPYVRGPSALPESDAGTAARELGEAARAALRALPDDLRTTFLMNRQDGLTYAEIARVLDISVKTVEARMGRALRSLREQLAAWLPEGGGW